MSDDKKAQPGEDEVSGLAIADQIGTIWAMAKRGNGSAEDIERAASGLGQMIAQFARQGGALGDIGYSLGMFSPDRYGS
jgi:hypothetical protein